MWLDKERYEELQRGLLLTMLVIVLIFEILCFAGILGFLFLDLVGLGNNLGGLGGGD